MKFAVSLLYGLTCLSGLSCKTNNTKKEDSEYSLSSDVSPYTFENQEEFDAYKKKLRESNASIPRSSESLTFSARDFSNIVDDSSGSYHDSDSSGEDSFYYDLNPPRSRENKSETQTETVRAEDFFKTPEERERIWKEKQKSLEEFKKKLKGNNKNTFYKPAKKQAANILDGASFFDDDFINRLVRHPMKGNDKKTKNIKKENSKPLEYGKNLQQKNSEKPIEDNLQRRKSQETIYTYINKENKPILNDTKSKTAVVYDTDKTTKSRNGEEYKTRNLSESHYKKRNKTTDSRKNFIYANSLEVTNASTIDWNALIEAMGESTEDRYKHYRYGRGKNRGNGRWKYGEYSGRGHRWDKNRWEYNQHQDRDYHEYGNYRQRHRIFKDIRSRWDRGREKNIEKEDRRKLYGENRNADYRSKTNWDNREDRNEQVFNTRGDRGFTKKRYKKSGMNTKWRDNFQKNNTKYDREFRKDPREIMFMNKLLEQEGNDRLKIVRELKHNPYIEEQIDSDWGFRKDKSRRYTWDCGGYEKSRSEEYYLKYKNGKKYVRDRGNRKEMIRDKENNSYMDFEDQRNIERKYNKHDEEKNRYKKYNRQTFQRYSRDWGRREYRQTGFDRDNTRNYSQRNHIPYGDSETFRYDWDGKKRLSSNAYRNVNVQQRGARDRKYNRKINKDDGKKNKGKGRNRKEKNRDTKLRPNKNKRNNKFNQDSGNKNNYGSNELKNVTLSKLKIKVVKITKTPSI